MFELLEGGVYNINWYNIEYMHQGYWDVTSTRLRARLFH